MVKITLDLDLNQLSDSELEAYLVLKRKGNQPTAQPVATVAVKPIVDKSHGEKKRTYHTKKSIEVIHALTDLLMKHPNMSFNEAFIKVKGRSPSGQEKDSYQRRVKIALGSKRMWAERLGKTVAVPEKEVIFITKKEKTRKPYMIREKSYMDLRGRHIKNVMRYCNTNLQGAVKIIANSWNESGKVFSKAEDLINQHIQLHNAPKKEVVDIKFRELKGDKMFPNINGIQPALLPIVEDMSKKIIMDNSLSLSLAMEGALLGIVSYNDWSNFCTAYGMKSKEIAEYFGVADKFKISTLGKDIRIRYG